MKYESIFPAIFLQRKNRFVAEIEVSGNRHNCHVKNTGRCAELFIPGTPIYVQHCASPNRSTEYDLISVYKGDTLINVDSQIPNKVTAEWLAKSNYIPGLTLLKPEQKYQNSRFDFYYETPTEKGFIEVKGVTLEENGIAKFPDAPTLRGVKHVKELIHCHKNGFGAHIIFIIQMKNIHTFTPNYATHPEFGGALQQAKQSGVSITAVDCTVTPTEIVADAPIKIQL